MREHQIAISLKPQQFELLQQLARERGFKSVTAYVKQKIVELALGVESDEAAQGFAYEGTAGYKGNGAEYQALLGDLSRIHNELKAFVGQSAPESHSLQAPSSADPFNLPPPGQIHPGSVNLSPNPLSGRSQSEASTALGIPSRRAEGEPVSAQILPSTNLGGFGFRLGGFSDGGGQSRYQPPVNNADKLSGYREVMDDLEELADRAFAISPRLGALDEQAQPEAGTARGGRPPGESIFVEPILPRTSDKDTARRAPQAKAAPINMVTPVTPANLPGPDQMQVTSAPLPAVAAPGTSPPPQAPSPAAPTPPLPGDDLLSELLDESLVAHAEAPRPADNPYAVKLGFVGPDLEESDNEDDASAGESVEAEGDSLIQDTQSPDVVSESTAAPNPEPISEPVSELISDPATHPIQTAVDQSEKKEQSLPSASNSASDSEETNAAAARPASPNISGGPPPRRRRT